MLLPNGEIDFTEELSEEKTVLTKRDYKIENGRIIGFVDGIDAVNQACKKVFNTERFVFTAYNFDYGIELVDTIGQHKDYVIADLKRRFEEALINVKGVEKIVDFTIEKVREGLSLFIVILTEYGNIEINEEVKI